MNDSGNDPLTFGAILRRTAERDPNKIAIIAGARRLTFAELDRDANRLAHFLIAHGVRPGDRIACLLFNSPEYAALHFGSARAGSVLVHISPLLAATEIENILRRTTPRVLVFDAALRDTLPDEVLSGVETVLAVGEEAGNIDKQLAEQPDTPPAAVVDPDAPAAMTFTGGTTGRPKGTVVNHRARHISAEVTAREHRLGERDIVGVVTPMFHAVGLMIWYQAAVLVGATSVLLRKWNPATFVAQTERCGISAVFMVPVQLRDLLRAPQFNRQRLASLTNIGVGGGLTPPELIAECRTALPHAGYTDHYGQSETGPLTILPPEDAEAHAGSIGKPVAGVELRIVDPEGEPMPPGSVGELVTRGPFLMDGYFDDPEETASYFRRGDGWGWTGDLATEDELGFIRLVGRTREVIVSGGFNIYPGEIEAALGSHPVVEDCAVFGVPDERWGETPVACVVTTATDEASPEELRDELIAHCTTQLARYKRPSDIVFVDAIPRTPAGKVPKARLRDAWLSGEVPTRSVPSGETSA